MKHGIGLGNNRFPSVILKMSHKTVYIFIFLILLSSVMAQELISKEPIIKEPVYEFRTSVASEPLQVKEYSEREYTISDKSTVKYIDTKIESARTKVELVNVKITDKQPLIKITDGRSSLRGSDIITINDIELDLGIITLEKYYIGSNVSLLYSVDGFDYELADINFMQNSTHLWFNTTHFSSFTTTMPDIKVWTDGYYSNLAIDLSDFATITSGYTSFVSHIITDGTSTGNTGYVDSVFCRIINDGTNNVGEICALEGNIFQFYSTITSGDFLDSTSGARFSILDDFDYVDASSNQLDIIYQKSFEEPDVNRFGVDNIVSGSVRLRGRVYFNDVAYILPYYEKDGVWGFDSTGDHLDAQFYYRKQGTSIYSVADFGIINSGTIFSKTITGLDDDSTYEYFVRFYYFNPEDNFEVFKDSTVGTFNTYTEPVPSPTVDTLPATNTVTVEGTTATLNAIADFDGYTDPVRGRLCYREGTSGLFDCNSFATITHNTQFSRSLTGLTADTSYQFYAEIDWDSASFNDLGDILTFTPTVAVETDLLADLISYYKLDETSGTTAIDSHGSNDGVIFGNGDWTTSGLINGGYTQSGTTSDRIDLDTQLASGKNEFTFSVWIYPTSKTETFHTIASEMGSTSSNRVFDLYMRSANDYDIQLDFYETGTGRHLRATGVTAPNNEWTNIIAVYDGVNNIIQLWVNGIKEDELTGVSLGSLNVGAYDFVLNNIGSSIGNNRAFYGITDEVAIYNRALSSDEITELYNSGDGLSYDDFEAEATPTTTTLEVQDITEDTATLRQIPDFGDYTGDVWGIYQIIKVEDAVGDPSEWEWTVYPSGFLEGTAEPFSLTDNTIHSIGVTNLRYNTQYYVQGVAVWDYNSVSGLYNGYFYSEEVTFTTNSPTLPTIDVLTPLQVSFNSAVPRGRVLTLGSFDTVEFSLWFDGSKIFETTTSDFGMVDGIQGQSVSGLTENTTYCYDARVQVSWTDDDGFKAETQQTEQMCFNTTFEGDPSINTLPATNIKREEAQLNFEIFDLGMHESIPIYFEYWNEGNESESIITDQIPYFEIVEGGVKVENLMMNTTYYYRVLTEINDREISGGTLDFMTLSIDDFLAPTLELSVADIGMTSINVNAFLDLNDAENVDLYFYLFDNTETLINTTLYMDANETRMWSSLFDGLESQARYYYQAEAFYYDTDTNTTESILTFRDTAVTLNVFETPTRVCIIDRLCLDIQDRYLFMMLFIVGMSIIGLGFSVGSSFSQFSGAERLLSFGVTFFVIISAIWLNAVQVMPTWIFIYIAVGSTLIFIFYVLRGVTGGSVYG